MADLQFPMLPATVAVDDDPEATMTEQDEESTLLRYLSIAFASLVMIYVFVLKLRYCRTHQTIMGVRALGVLYSQHNQVVKDHVPLADPKFLDRHWKVTYSTSTDLSRGRLKAYDGTLDLAVKDNWLILRNAKGTVIGRRGAKSKDSFSIGAKILFPSHVVRLGVPLVFTNDVQSSVLGTEVNIPATSTVPATPSRPHTEQLVMPREEMPTAKCNDQSNSGKSVRDECLEEESSFANSVHASLFRGLSFSHGLNFAKDVKNFFNVDVHPSSKSCNFLMVVSFGHANFRMEEDLVSIALESVIGGYCGNLKVSLIKDRVFSFCVSAKDVGFHVLKLRKYSCQQFQCYFHLWGRGGPNWKWEFNQWNIQTKAEWTLVSSPKKTLQRGLAALKSKAPRSALAKSHVSGKKLQFAETIHYEACLGYQCPDGASVQENVMAAHAYPLHSAESSGNSQGKEILPGSGLADDVSHEQAQKYFEKLVDDMVYKVWACGRCLHMGHQTKDCTNDIRCRACFSYGHIKKNCLGAKQKSAQIWVPKRTKADFALNTAEISLTEAAVPPSTSFIVNPLESKQGPSASPKPPPDLAVPASSEEMVVFEVDPLPWLPWGHQIIDGGPTRLSRTYYYAAQDPPVLHQSFCIATVDPPPQPQGEEFWREQVHNFLVGPLQRNVISSQPSLFGAGMFELSSPNSVNALVQHGQYQIQNRTLRFLHVGDAPQNHRAVLGFRRGWLMFLGVHLDYRNNLDIANAVSTFGQYHTWNNNDPVKDRVLVYASFPSPQLVPRDVVFGKFATVGGVKESWTASVYILTADFADVLPADEDQMPLDGNPHPFPGVLLQNNNVFVNPQFPEIGWDAVQDVPGNNNNAEDVNWNQQDQMDDVQQEDQESMLLNLSDSPASLVNMMGMEIIQQQHGNVLVNLQVLSFQVSYSFVGPAPPPEMQWSRLMDKVLPLMQTQLIIAPLQGSLFGFLSKSNWDKGIVGKYEALLQKESGEADFSAVLVDSDNLPGHEFSSMENRDLPLSTPKRKNTRKSAAPVV
ncbi:hypothetical protein ACQ4PT_024153 [Festuca glaucescens]